MAASGTLIIRFIGDLKEFEAATAALGTRLRSTGKMLTKSLTLPILAAGTAAVVLASNFEDGMSKIEGLVGVSAKQVQHFSDVILTEGPKWGKSPQELADALYFVTSAGFRGAKALDILKTSAKASSAGLGETKTVADLLTSAMNAYGDGNLSAAHAADVLTAAVRSGKMESTDLATAMPKVLGMASALGVSFDESAAAIASFSMQGTNAANGATQLRSIFGALLRPTTQANDQLKSMGLSAEGLRQELSQKGLLATLETLRTKFKGNTAATANVFGNVRALTGVMELMGKNVDKTRGIFDGVTHATGSMDKAFEVASQTTSFKFHKALGELQSSLIRIGLVLLPVVSKALDHLTVLIGKGQQAWSKLSDGQQHIILVALGIAAAVGPVLIVLGKLLAVISLFANPVGLIVLAVIALVGVFALLVTKSSTVRDALLKLIAPFTSGGFVDSIKGLGQSLVQFFNGLLPTLQKVGSQLMGALGPAFAQIANVLSTQLFPAIQRLLPIIEPIAKVMIQIFGVAVVNAIKGVSKIVVGLITELSGVINLVVALIHGDWKGAWAACKQILSGAVKVMQGTIQLGFGLMLSIVKKILGDVLSFVGSLPGRLAHAVGDLGGLLLSKGKSLMEGLLHGIQHAWGAVTSWLAGLPGRVAGAVPNLGNILAPAGRAVMDGLIRGIQSMTKPLTSALHAVTSLIPKHKGPPSKDAKLLHPAGIAIMQGLIKGLQGGGEGVSSYLDGLSKRIGKSLDKLYDGKQLQRHTKKVMDAIAPLEKALRQQGKALDAWKKSLQSAKDALAAKQQAAADYARGIADTFASFGDITSLGQRTDASGNAVDPTGASILADLAAKADQAKKFQAVIAQLTKAHLNATTLQQLLAQGPDALATAQALASGGGALIKQVNAYAAQIAAAGTATGTAAAQTFYGAGIAAAQGLVNGLLAKEPDIEKIAKRLANKLAKAIREALKVKSPSRVFHFIGRMVALGLENGMLAGSKGVMKAANQLAQMTTVAASDRRGMSLYAPTSAPGGGGAGGSAGGPDIKIHQHFPISADPMAAANAAAGRIVAALGV